MQFANAKILIFAKAPEPGLAKTRLAPAIGEFQAAQLSEALLNHAVQRVVDAELAKVELHCTPDINHLVFKSLGKLPAVTLFEQSAGDLGARMHHGLRQALKESEAVLLVGTDAPSLQVAHMQQALQLLQAAPEQVVISPAEDGGYAMLGLGRDCPSLFSEMPWGSAEVLTTTLARCRQAGRDVVLLPEVWDVDRPEDIQRLRMLGDWDQHLPSE